MKTATHPSEDQTRTAAQQVLSTPELLEIILSQLSFCDLLVSAQRVNRAFNAVISRSQSIQRALFFLPAIEQADPQPCPLLRASSTTRFVDRRVEDWIQVQRDLRKQGKTEYLNEWLDDSDLKPYHRNTASSARKEAMSREEASWRSMLIFQPPIKEVHIDSGKGWVASQNWLRMGDLHKNVVTCRHIAVDQNGIGNLRVQHYSHG
ncbi:hypothetical protein BKA64DRAFT_701003 [Cadophora sp. MPI-SDFR-AT-0126]|nr:hypothetical protein BKA64DRAFT_701003 [Leotiomycetes sp. MPI-SDFR-AT-0126]